MPEIIHYTPDLSWKNLHEFPGNAEVQVFHEESRTKEKAIIVRLPAGGHIDPRTHAANVHHYILEGEYKTQGKVLEASTYRLLPKFQDVSPITTQSGVMILMIYEPV